ncbi:unnamed protein product, partial [Closterium sp. NIES-54]
GPAPLGVSQVDPPPLAVPAEVAVDSGVARGAEPASAEPGGAEPGGAESEGADCGVAEPEGAELGGTEPQGAEPGGAESEGVEFGGVEPRSTASAGGPAGASPRVPHRREPLSPQQLREWFAQRTHVKSGLPGLVVLEALELEAGGAGGAGSGGTRASSSGGARVTAGAGGTGAAGAAGGARTGGTRAAGASGVGGAGAEDPRAGGTGGAGAGGNGAGGAGAGGTRAGDPGARGACVGGTGGGGIGAGRTPDSPLPAPSSYAEQTDSLTERRGPESRPALPVRAVHTGRRVPRPRPPPVLGTHIMALRPSSVPLRVPLPSPPTSSLPDVPDLEFDLARAASRTVPRLLTTVVTDPSFGSTSAFALVAELVEFAVACHLDYAISLVADSHSDYPPSIGGESALGTDVLEDRQEDFE